MGRRVISLLFGGLYNPADETRRTRTRLRCQRRESQALTEGMGLGGRDDGQWPGGGAEIPVDRIQAVVSGRRSSGRGPGGGIGEGKARQGQALAAGDEGLQTESG